MILPYPKNPLYSVNSLGIVYGLKGQPLKVQVHAKTGYCYVSIAKRLHSLHGVVCRTFHGEPPTPKHEPNHKNGIKTDNCESNLEWMTRSENIRHSYHTLKRRDSGVATLWKGKSGKDHNRSLPITLRNVNTNEVLSAGSYSEMSRMTGLPVSTVRYLKLNEHIHKTGWQHWEAAWVN